ncbi:hypothetical protein GJ496_010947 [Pomphorhynchus laevis]|nr:hypothetical protein GJ496_010947 [Pomphorhynchus laevis]
MFNIFSQNQQRILIVDENRLQSSDMQLATFAAGCFWCIQEFLSTLNGVQNTIAGYTGGSVPNPTYAQVCNGTSGYVEAVQFKYDPAIISYDTLLNVFFDMHDPTQWDRQGNDVGPQYRSIIFYHDDKQKHLAERKIFELGVNYKNPIVTQLKPAVKLYPAEPIHQFYFRGHKSEPYCSVTIVKKLMFLRNKYKHLLKI